MDGAFFEPLAAAPVQRDSVRARFFTKPIPMTFLSEQAGKPIYEDRDFVEMYVPGNRGAIHSEQVTTEHQRRWPREWDAYKQGKEAPVTGTRIEELPGIGNSLVLMLKSQHIHTIEDLANVADGDLSNVGSGMGGLMYRDKARIWLKNATEGQPLSEAIARAVRAEAEVERLGATVADLASKFDAMERAQVEKRGPGRPRKDPAED